MIPNKAKFDYNDLIVLFGKNNLRNISPRDQFIGVSIDSRTIEHGNIFVAIKGENTDGHSKINHAFGNGASLAIAETEKWNEKSDKPLVIVRNTTTALGILANHHRRRFNYPVIAIAGSNGKTTTKEISSHLLSQRYNVLKTFRNFNNQIGTPLMLLQMTDEYDMAVLEIGTNEPGEIIILSEMVEPTHGIITNIGKEHLEKLENLDGVELEETSLFGYLIRNNGLVFLNMDDTRISKYIKILPNCFTYGDSEDNNLKAKIEIDDQLLPSMDFLYNGRKIAAKMNEPGITMGINAVAASALALHFGHEDQDIIKGLESFENLKFENYGRLLTEKVDGITIINDTYNANPESMQKAVESLVSILANGKRYACLSDMLELGKHSNNEHLELLDSLSSKPIEVLITGNEMKSVFDNMSHNTNINFFSEKQEMIEVILDLLADGDIILVKGSRGMRMEKIVDAIKNKFSDK